MTGIAKPRPRIGKRIKDTVKSESELHSLFRRADTPSAISVPSFSGSSGGSNAGVSSSNFLPTSGGTMIGAIAFNIKSGTISSGALDVSKDGTSYSSRVIVFGEGNVADDLEVITGANNGGQLLFFQAIQEITLKDSFKSGTGWTDATSYSVGDVSTSGTSPFIRRYVCRVAHTSNTATNKPGSGSDWETFWYSNNIRITGDTERVVAVDEIILLQWDATDAYWTMVSSGSGSNLLTNSNNVWTGVNTFQSTVSMTGPTVNLGDSSGDRVNFISQAGTDINMGTYDVINVDRLKFSTTAGSGSALTSSDTGIEAQFSGGSSYGMKFQTPASNVYQYFIGTAEKINISSSVIVLNDDTTIGGELKVSGGNKVKSSSSTEIGFYVTNATSSIGSEGTVQIPTKNTGVGSASVANADFGSEKGCIGLYTLGNPTLVIKYSSTAWQGIILGSSGNATVFQF
jgi:hypothetical protein